MVNRAMEILSTVADPEIPALNIIEMGIVRNVEESDGGILVSITPTYSGCPALQVIEADIVRALQAEGFAKVRTQVILSPPWTTDWMSEETKSKLLEYGISPPAKCEEAKLVPLPANRKCPFCGSTKSEVQSEFGSTPCKGFVSCLSCGQSYEAFKSI